MVLVGGLFASLTLPAYASADYNAVALDAAAPADAQELSLDMAKVDSVAASGEARDGYAATSAVDLKRLYLDAVRQQNLAAYLASGAKEMGDDYPWAAELADYQGGGLSPLNYFYRECVDFVAWRLNRDAGYTKAPFKWVWSTLTPGAGSARSWKSQWEKHGWPISTTPAPGWVAWFPGGNHVAYVSGISTTVPSRSRSTTGAPTSTTSASSSPATPSTSRRRPPDPPLGRLFRSASVAQWKSSSVLRKGLGVRVPPGARTSPTTGRCPCLRGSWRTTGLVEAASQTRTRSPGREHRGVLRSRPLRVRPDLSRRAGWCAPPTTAANGLFRFFIPTPYLNLARSEPHEPQRRKRQLAGQEVSSSILIITAGRSASA